MLAGLDASSRLRGRSLPRRLVSDVFPLRGRSLLSPYRPVSPSLLVFVHGQILDARSGDRTGLAAAEHILRRHHGSFAFVRESTAERERVITQDTMALLMEAHRRID